MAQKGIFFGGRQILLPGAYAIYHNLSPAPIQVAATNVVALLGRSTGGLPFAATGIGNSDMDAVKTLFKGGALVDAAELAMYPLGRNVEDNPNPGATSVVLVRVGGSTTLTSQGKLAINNQAGTPIKIGDVVSRDYGLYVNKIQVNLSDGASGTVNAGKVQVIIQNTFSTPAETEFSPFLGHILGLTNKTVDGELKLTVNDTSFKIEKVPSTGPRVTIFEHIWANNADATISQLAESLAATLKAAEWTVTILGSPDMKAQRLDRVTDAALTARTGSAAPYTYTEVKVTGYVGAVDDWMNRESKICKFDLATTGAIYGAKIEVFSGTAPWKNLTGGADGDELKAGWERAFNLLKELNVYFVVPVITTADGVLEADIRQLAMDHVFAMRDIKVRRRRQLFIGHKRGLLTEDATGVLGMAPLEDIANDFNSSAVAMFTPGITRTLDGTKKDLSAYYLAAAAAGIKAGASPQMPLIFKKVKIEDVEYNYDIAEREAVIKAGANFLGIDRGIARFGEGQTTWLQSSDPVKSEISMVHIGDTISATAEADLEEKYGGRPFGGPTHVAAFKSDFEKILRTAQELGMIVDGSDPKTGEFVSAFRDVKVSFASGRWSAKATVTGAEPGRYITIEFGFASAAGTL